MDFVRRWSRRAEMPAERFIRWLGLGTSKFYDWRRRYGRVNEHNAWVPRDHWLTPEEREAILAYHRTHPDEGYRRLTYMMLDADIVAVSASTTYRVLREAGVLRAWNPPPSTKGQGFHQPVAPHEHWHVDITYLRLAGTFFYLCVVLDGASRYLVHWELRPQMTEQDVELTIQRAKERFPGARPRIISDNGPQFLAKDFKEFIRLSEMTHVRTSPYYPQSNGKLERWNHSFKSEGFRPSVPLTFDDAWRVAARYVAYYNTERLHSAIGYVTPQTRLEGRQHEIFDARDRKLDAARARRAVLRRQYSDALPATA
ncbi:MAG: IS3 family transposase [Gemmatimonadaceae bacterium]